MTNRKKSLTLRIDLKTFKSIDKWAEEELRSVNSQLEWIINKSLEEHKDKKSKKNCADSNEAK